MHDFIRRLLHEPVRALYQLTAGNTVQSTCRLTTAYFYNSCASRNEISLIIIIIFILIANQCCIIKFLAAAAANAAFAR